MRTKNTEPVRQETELQGCSIDGNPDSTESGAGGHAMTFVKAPSLDGTTSVRKMPDPQIRHFPAPDRISGIKAMYPLRN